jgi:2-keto-4-pentenoate hydratase/2-oxohepta-3-ene-1,7-dioic acid hydratase in catechol pathway
VFYALLEGEDRAIEIEGGLSSSPRARGPGRPIAGLRSLVPFTPTKIIGVGRNYRAHALELKHAIPSEPLLFLKPVSALLAPGEAIRLPRESRRVDYEGELGVIVGRAARRVRESEAMDYVLGLTCVNDVTARDLQERDVQFTRAKGFDTFCPAGPCVALGLDPSALTVETYVNGARRQSAAVSSMIFGIARLLSYASDVMTLLPGDLITTGTPDGVGPLAEGDEVTVAIAGIGRLTSRVEAERP